MKTTGYDQTILVYCWKFRTFIFYLIWKCPKSGEPQNWCHHGYSQSSNGVRAFTNSEITLKRIIEKKKCCFKINLCIIFDIYHLFYSNINLEMALIARVMQLLSPWEQPKLVFQMVSNQLREINYKKECSSANSFTTPLKSQNSSCHAGNAASQRHKRTRYFFSVCQKGRKRNHSMFISFFKHPSLTRMKGRRVVTTRYCTFEI